MIFAEPSLRQNSSNVGFVKPDESAYYEVFAGDLYLRYVNNFEITNRFKSDVLPALMIFNDILMTYF